MRVIDISGPIYDGMWNYSEPLASMLGSFKLSKIRFDFGGEKYTIDVFDGFKAQTGTYIESPGQYLENNDYKISDIPIDKLFMIDTYVLKIPYAKLSEKDGKKFVTPDEIFKAELENIPQGKAILIATGYGKYWESKDFFHRSWFFKREAMEYIISKKPFLLGTDSAEWENPKNPEGIFKMFYPANILILASCINLQEIKEFRVKLTVLPFKVTGSCIAPVRAMVLED
jgi:kynurenine formamidase